MRQVKFTTKYKKSNKIHNAEVVCGWDGHYFLSIFNLDAKDNEDNILYCQLNDFPAGEPKVVAPLQKELFLLGVDPPDGFWERVCRKEGNVIYSLTESGWRKENV